MKEDEREVLTDACIREDLADRIKMTAIHLGVYLPVLALWVLLLTVAPGLIFVYLLVNIILVAALVYYMRRIMLAVSGYLYCRKTIRVVTDKKTGHKIEYPWWTGNAYAMFRKWCYLFFNKYGRYHLPLTSYKWSYHYQINHMELMESSYDKDEFYLVLDKKDRILMAYPCKSFRYEETSKGEVE